MRNMKNMRKGRVLGVFRAFSAGLVTFMFLMFFMVRAFGEFHGSQDDAALRATDAPPNAIWIDSLDLTKMVQRRQTPRAGGTLAGGGGRGRGGAPTPITLGGVVYPHGIGTLSINELIV